MTICNVGAFYCGADVHFLKKRKRSTVYALDFGDLETLNNDILNDRLKLYPGYPLETLESFVDKNDQNIFDYLIFTRTANLMNTNELFLYMKNVAKLAKNVCFFENAKTTSLTKTVLDIASIELKKPVKIFNNMRIHNYGALLEHFGYKVVDNYVLPFNAFKQEFTSDHYFVFASGTKEDFSKTS